MCEPHHTTSGPFSLTFPPSNAIGVGENYTMGQILVGMGLKLHDVGGDTQIGDLDRVRLLSDLRDAGVPERQRNWLSLQQLESFDRILVARDLRTGRVEGAMLVQHRSVDGTPFLAIEALSGTPAIRGQALLQRMLAWLLLRLDVMEQRPAAILACTRNLSLCRVLRDVAGGIGGAKFYPERDDATIPLPLAAAAHRMARQVGHPHRFDAARQALRDATTDAAPDGPMLALLDVGTVPQAALEDDARRLFRARLPRTAVRRATGDVVIRADVFKRRFDAIPRGLQAMGSVYPIFGR